MRCCVPLCDISSETLVSKSRSVFKPKAVTFHGFPTAAKLRNLWLTNLGIDKHRLPEGAVVCSQHFNKYDFYFTRSNFRKLRCDAVPLEVVPPEAKFCVICLDTGCTLYPLGTQNLHKAYRNLTGISMTQKFNNVLKLCTECAQRLINYCKLRDKSLRAHNFMLQLVREHGQLTTHNVRTVDRVENKLASDLVQNIFEPDYFGPYIMDNGEESDVTNKALKPFEGEYLSMKSDISDHNYSKLDDEIDSDVNYEIERPGELEEMHGADIKTNKNILDEFIKSRKMMKSPSSDVELENDKFYGDNDEFEDLYGDDIKPSTKIFDDDEFNSCKVKKSILNYDTTYYFESDNDKFYGDSDEFEDMYDDDEFKTNSKIHNYEFNSCKVKKSISNNGKSNETDDDKLEVDFEVEYLNNYFGENIEYLQDDIEHVALALGAQFNDEKKKGGDKKQARNVRHSYVMKKQEKPDLSMFKISQLSQEDAVAEIMKRKDEDNYMKSLFKCTKCYKAYTNKDAFDAHMERHTEKFGPLVCEVCKTHKWNLTQLKNHQRNFHTLKYSCTLCPVVKTNKYMAVMHERWHKGLKYECPHCLAQYSKHSTYMQHLRSKHPSDIICPHCGYSFVGEEGLKNHMLEVHPVVNPAQSLEGPRCEDCNVVFASVSAHRQHLEVSPKHAHDGSNDRDDASQHQACKSGNQTGKTRKKRHRHIVCEECGAQVIGFRRYYSHLTQHGKVSAKSTNETAMCEQCGKLFKSHTLLRYHMPLHSGRRQFACEVCGKRFMLRANLYLHRRVHRENRPRYECELCGKHFANTMGRARHIQYHHSTNLWLRTRIQKENRPRYECELCGKHFANMMGRARHIQYHHSTNLWLRTRIQKENRPRYECELCGKHFANTMGRARHIQIIHNSVKYKCDRCEKTFTTVFGRKMHVKHVHDKVPYPKREPKRKKTARPEPQVRRTHITSDSDTQ